MHAADHTKPAEPLFIVLNAGSGRGDVDERRATIQAVLEQARRRHEFLVVQDSARIPSVARHAVELARTQQGIVVAAGGDGTINAVAQAVLTSGRPLGVLPQGTFNYFGRTYGIPTDTAAATRVLLNSMVRPVQVGLINNRVFLVNASVGMYPQLLEDREAYNKKFGRSRLIALWSGIMTLLRRHRQLVLQLEHEGKARTMRTPTLVVGNNMLQLEQIGIREAPAVRQGELVAIAVRPVSKLDMLGLLMRGALGQLGDAENIVSFAFKRLTVRLRRSYGRRRVKVARDGEVSWLGLPLVFEVAPNPLPLLVPISEGEPATAA
jgi:diacylglycerol kinase family enzyme